MGIASEKKTTVGVHVDKAVYLEFSEYTNKRGLRISSTIETVLLWIIKNDSVFDIINNVVNNEDKT